MGQNIRKDTEWLQLQAGIDRALTEPLTPQTLTLTPITPNPGPSPPDPKALRRKSRHPSTRSRSRRASTSPYISPISRLYLAYISLYLAYISLYLPAGGRRLRGVHRPLLQGDIGEM